jgi:hypothetical protein
MTLGMPRHICQRLAAIIDDSKNAIEQEAAKATYYHHWIAGFEPGAKLYIDLWTECTSALLLSGKDRRWLISLL